MIFRDMSISQHVGKMVRKLKNGRIMAGKNSAKESLQNKLKNLESLVESKSAELTAANRRNCELSLALRRIEDKAVLAEMRHLLPETHEVADGGKLITRTLNPREKEAAAITAMATMSATPLSERLTDARHKKIEGNLMRSAEVGMDIEADLMQIVILVDEMLEFDEHAPHVLKKIKDLATRAQNRVKLIYPETDR